MNFPQLTSRPICTNCNTWIAYIEHYNGYNNGAYVCEFCGGQELEHVLYIRDDCKMCEEYDAQYRFLKFMKGEK
jgi:hypothetical protein